MTALLRPASSAVMTALANKTVRARADLFTFVLMDGATVFNWTSWDRDLTVGGIAYSSKGPWLQRTSWNVANTMEVASLTVKLVALNAAFAGSNIKTQVHNGLFDGASFLLTRAFMSAVNPPAVIGTVGLFGGLVGGIDLTGSTATLTIKGKNNLLDQYAPRNLYQIGCNHAFCDVGCTLNAASFTSAKVVGSGATSSFIPWAAAPATPAVYQNGEITMTGGAASGQSRTIASANAGGLNLTYPLYQTPAAGDTFTALRGCSKAYSDGSGQSCSDYANTQNYKGYPYVPPPNAAY